MAAPKNFINSVVFAKPALSQADGLPRFYPTVDLQGGNIENVVLINGELPLTVPPTGGFVRYDACDGTIYDLPVNLMDGSSNIQLGYQAGDYGKGSRNVMIGYFAASGNATDLSDSVVIGTQAGVNSDGSNNVFIGPYAGYYTSGSNNILLGRNSGQLQTISDRFIVADGSDVLISGNMKTHALDICGNMKVLDVSASNIQSSGKMSVGNITTFPVSTVDIKTASTPYTNNEQALNSLILRTGSSSNEQTTYFGVYKDPVNVSNNYSYMQSASYGVAPNPLLINRRGGNVIIGSGTSLVGIGKTPTQALDVLGTTNTDKLLSIDASFTNLNVSGNTILGKLVATDSSLTNLTISSNLYAPNDISAGDISFNIIQGSRVVATDASFTNITVSGIEFATNDISAVDVSCANIQVSNRVGVGLGSGIFPATSLVAASSGSYNTGIAVKNSDVYTVISNKTGSNYGSIQTTYGGTNSTVGTNPYGLLIQPLGGEIIIGLEGTSNVGIGKGPSYSLDVSGTVSISNSINSNTSNVIRGPFYTFNLLMNSAIVINQQYPTYMDLTSAVSWIDDISNSSGAVYQSYPTSNGAFTAPITGIYVLGFTVRMENGSYPATFRIYNAVKVKYYPESEGIWTSTDGSATDRDKVVYTTTQYLQANDVIYMQCATENTAGGDNIFYLKYWGYLLHSL